METTGHADMATPPPTHEQQETAGPTPTGREETRHTHGHTREIGDANPRRGTRPCFRMPPRNLGRARCPRGSREVFREHAVKFLPHFQVLRFVRLFLCLLQSTGDRQ